MSRLRKSNVANATVPALAFATSEPGADPAVTRHERPLPHALRLSGPTVGRPLTGCYKCGAELANLLNGTNQYEGKVGVQNCTPISGAELANLLNGTNRFGAKVGEQNCSPISLAEGKVGVQNCTPTSLAEAAEIVGVSNETPDPSTRSPAASRPCAVAGRSSTVIDRPRPRGDRSMTGNGLASAPMLDLKAAAAMTGRTTEALRSMARRGRISSKRGNAGRLLVEVPSWLIEPAGQQPVTTDRSELAELRSQLATAATERDRLLTELAKAEADRAAGLRIIDVLEAQLAWHRLPLWRRWLGPRAP